MEPLTTVEFAETFFADRLYTERWDEATPENKHKAIYQASRDIRKYFVLQEEAFQEQVNEDGTKTLIAVPQLQEAVCLQAIYLLGTNPAEYPDVLTKGIKSASAGSLNATFDKSFVPLPVAVGVEDAIGELGTYIGPSESGSVTTFPLSI